MKEESTPVTGLRSRGDLQALLLQALEATQGAAAELQEALARCVRASCGSCALVCFRRSPTLKPERPGDVRAE